MFPEAVIADVDVNVLSSMRTLPQVSIFPTAHLGSHSTKAWNGKLVKPTVLTTAAVPCLPSCPAPLYSLVPTLPRSS